VGLHTDPRRAEERRPSSQPSLDRPDPEIAWHATGAGTTTSWQTFLHAHWGAIAGADFFTTEVWTWRGLVTYYTVFVIDLALRRVQIVGLTPNPHDLPEHARSTASPLGERPFPRNQLPIPAENCVGRDDRGDVTKAATAEPVSPHGQPTAFRIG